MKKNFVILATSCSEEKCCPVVGVDKETSIVTLYDPEKPLRGSFCMKLDEMHMMFEEDPRIVDANRISGYVTVRDLNDVLRGAFALTVEEWDRLKASHRSNG